MSMPCFYKWKGKSTNIVNLKNQNGSLKLGLREARNDQVEAPK